MYSALADSTPTQQDLPLLTLHYVCTLKYSAPNDSQGKETKATDNEVGCSTTNPDSPSAYKYLIDVKVEGEGSLYLHIKISENVSWSTRVPIQAVSI